MDKVRFTLPYRLPSLNEYVAKCRSNKYEAAEYKRDIESEIIWLINGIKPIENPVFIDFIWYEPNQKRDKDNVCFAKKFILDAMQKAGVLKNDNNRFVLGFTDTFVYNKTAQVVAKIREVKS